MKIENTENKGWMPCSMDLQGQYFNVVRLPKSEVHVKILDGG